VTARKQCITRMKCPYKDDEYIPSQVEATRAEQIMVASTWLGDVCHCGGALTLTHRTLCPGPLHIVNQVFC